jgi:UDP-glucose 4-epimerase
MALFQYLGLAVYPMTRPAEKVLVTGAGGFIGRELCRQLAASGNSLVTLTRTPGSVADPVTNEFGTPDFSGDICDRALLERAMDGVQVVYHLAGIAHVDSPDPERLQTINTEGTRAVAQTAVRAGVRKVLYFSSSLAGAAETEKRNATAYGISKFQAEQCLLEITLATETNAVILRPVNVYGPGMKGNIAAMLRLIRRGLLPPLPKVDTRLSLIGLQDLCRAAQLAATSSEADGKIWYVTDGLEYRLNEIEAALYQTLGKKKPGWHSPRFVFFTAALLAGLVSRLSGGKTSLGIRTYRNLISDNLFSSLPIRETLGFTPQQTFYTALPGLIR